MTPYYQDDLVTIYHGDCLELGLSIETPAALVSDPPYGMAWDGRVTRGRNGTGSKGPTRHFGQKIIGDTEPFDPSPWLAFPEVILWGSNHYAQRLPVGTTLVWIKRYDTGFGSFLSDAEVAWMKGGHGVYCFRDLSMQGESDNREHPAQKPLPLMRWCIGKTTSQLVIDPFMGSGTTLVAAKEAGRRAIGIEIEERYCEIAATRCSQEVLGLAG
jgi:DNA modification methylase